MIIPVYNPEITDYEKSYLASDYSIGTTSIEVKNSDRFAANYRIMLGQMGQEKTEIVTVSAVNANGTTLTVGATVYPHSADDPVTVLQFDQVKFYRSTTGATGTYSLVTPVALDVDNDTLQTIYDDTSGLSTYYYKVSFYHSISAIESALSDPIPGSGWLRDQVGHVIDEILTEVSDEQEMHVTRGEMLGYFNDVNDDLTVNVSKPYDFLHSRTTLTRTANTNYINFPTDSNSRQTMWKFDRMDYNFTDSTTSPATDITYTVKVFPSEEFRNLHQDNSINSTTVSDKVEEMSIDTSVNRFRFWPPFETTGAGAFYLYYWKFFTVIDSEGDQIETPTPKIYKLYCKFKYYQKRSISDVTMGNLATTYKNEYEIEKVKYKGVDRKDAGTPRSFRPRSKTVKSFRR